MHFMRKERSTMERFLPGLDALLSDATLAVLESPASPGLALFRERGGPGLLVPKMLGGRGASLIEAAHIQRALGNRSPSLAIAVNMHACTVAAMPPCAATAELLQAVAAQNLYLASAFGEGQSGSSILAPRMNGTRVPGGWRLRGSKKPCSLSHSMDFLTASVLLPSPSGEGTELALAIIPADSAGIEIKQFSSGSVLAGSETHEVVLTDVEVPDAYISFFGNADALNQAISGAFLSFELLVSASYLGIASGLVERVLVERKGSPSERVMLVGELDAAMACIEATAAAIMDGSDDSGAVAQALYIRYAAQRAVEHTSTLAAELLGGMSFMGSGNSALLFTAARALAFHPPSRATMANALDKFIYGEPLIIP